MNEVTGKDARTICTLAFYDYHLTSQSFFNGSKLPPPPARPPPLPLLLLLLLLFELLLQELLEAEVPLAEGSELLLFS